MQSRYTLPLPMPSGGVHREMSQIDLPPETAYDAENWIYRDGRMRVRDGLVAIGTGTLTGRPNGFANWLDYAWSDTANPSQAILMVATASKWYEWHNVTNIWTDRGGSLNGNEVTHSISRIFQKGSASGTTTTMYSINGVDDNKKFVKGDSAVSAWTAGAHAPRAKAMMILGDRMLLGNVSQNAASSYTGAIGPQVVAVGASGDPEATAVGFRWDEVLIAQMQDTPGEIVCMLEMGNLQGAIYKTDAIYMAQAESNVVPFTFPLKAVVPGPVSPRAVVRINDSLHIYLATNGDVIRFDGVSATPMGRHLQRYVLDNWNSNLSGRSNGWYDHENNEVVIMFPDQYTGDCTRNINIRLADEPATLWPYTFTSKITAGIRAIIPGGVRYQDLDGVPSGETVGSLTLPLNQYNSLGTQLILGGSDGKTYSSEGGNDNGTPISAFFEGGLLAFDKPWVWKSIQLIDMVFEPTLGDSQVVTVALKGLDYGGAPVTLSAATTDIDGDGQHRTYHRCAARRLALRVSCEATEAVELNAGHLVYAEQGTR